VLCPLQTLLKLVYLSLLPSADAILAKSFMSALHTLDFLSDLIGVFGVHYFVDSSSATILLNKLV
jgi:hypothetical protein